MSDIAAGFNTRAKVQNEYTDSAKSTTHLKKTDAVRLKPVGAGFVETETTCTGLFRQNGLRVSQQRLLCDARRAAVVFGRRACGGEA